MLIWLNGAFGSGKTQTAYELNFRLPESFVCDPEKIGFTLFKVVPQSISSDFQDLALWRQFTRQTLEYILREYHAPVIVPMTIVVPEYHREIVEALRTNGFRVHHFTLMASRQTILKRLRRRGDGQNSWNAKQLDRCLEALKAPEFAEHLDTENRNLEQVAEEIAQKVGLTMRPPLRNPFQKQIRRILVQLRHIRLR